MGHLACFLPVMQTSKHRVEEGGGASPRAEQKSATVALMLPATPTLPEHQPGRGQSRRRWRSSPGWAPPKPAPTLPTLHISLYQPPPSAPSKRIWGSSPGGPCQGRTQNYFTRPPFLCINPKKRPGQPPQKLPLSAQTKKKARENPLASSEPCLQPAISFCNDHILDSVPQGPSGAHYDQ